MSATTLRTAAALADAGLIGRDGVAATAAVVDRYALALTPAMADLIDPTRPDDPIARQFLPDPRELEVTDDERFDPIGDAAHSPCAGIVHRYPDRVLLKLVQVCAVYCRFCFRRESVGPGHVTALAPDALATALAYIAAHPAVWEVILTGGDPLSAAPRRLAAVADRLAGIDHVRILRVHTRVPVVDPEAVTPAVVAALGASGKTVYVAIHANHPRELTAAARRACGRLAAAGFVLVSQTVLLKGVNDDVETLTALMRRFVEFGITPYYLHHPDLARGTSHFRLSVAEGQALLRQLQGRVSGLCQPRYVLDIPGGYGKAPIGPAYLDADDDGRLTVKDFNGMAHRYPPEPAARGEKP